MKRYNVSLSRKELEMISFCLKQEYTRVMENYGFSINGDFATYRRNEIQPIENLRDEVQEILDSEDFCTCRH